MFLFKVAAFCFLAVAIQADSSSSSSRDSSSDSSSESSTGSSSSEDSLDTSAKAGFNAARFTGVWYEYSRYYIPGREGDFCTSNTYTSTSQSHILDVLNQHRNADGSLVQVTGVAKLADVSVARLSIVASNPAYTAVYKILETDYDNFAIFYRAPDSQLRQDTIWILTKERQPSARVIKAAYAAAKARNVNIKALIRTSQKCPDYSAKTGFDTTRFVGVWSEYSRFFIPGREGDTCTSNTYTLTSQSNVLDVLNQHRNADGTLVRVTGVATLADVAVARLSIVASNPAYTAGYKILETDYDNFAIFYRAPDSRLNQETVWILTKDARPSPRVVKAAYAAALARGININALIRTSQINCPNTSAVTGFDSERFVGVWFEFSRFFIPGRAGNTCTSNTYTLTSQSNVLNVLNQHRESDGTLVQVTGVATLADPSVGRLSIVASNPGYTANYNIIDTDYDNYAIFYRAPDSRLDQETIWVLTKERQPSARVVTAAYLAVKARNFDVRFLFRTPQINC